MPALRLSFRMRKHLGLALTVLLLGPNIASATEEIPLREVKVHRISPERGAAFLNEAFPRTKSETPPKNFVSLEVAPAPIPLQAVPAPTPGRVLIVGMRKQLQCAELMLLLLDRLLPAPWL